jgi:hypothetical protein
LLIFLLATVKQKDNFHNLISILTKRTHLVWLIQQLTFLFPKGAVDGERPLKIPLYNLEFSSWKLAPSAT